MESSFKLEWERERDGGSNEKIPREVEKEKRVSGAERSAYVCDGTGPVRKRPSASPINLKGEESTSGDDL